MDKRRERQLNVGGVGGRGRGGGEKKKTSPPSTPPYCFVQPTLTYKRREILIIRHSSQHNTTSHHNISPAAKRSAASCINRLVVGIGRASGMGLLVNAGPANLVDVDVAAAEDAES